MSWFGLGAPAEATHRITFQTKPDSDKIARIAGKIAELLGNDTVGASKGDSVVITNAIGNELYRMDLTSEGLTSATKQYMLLMPAKLKNALGTNIKQFGEYIATEGALEYPSSGGGRKGRKGKKQTKKSKKTKNTKKSNKTSKKSKKSKKSKSRKH